MEDGETLDGTLDSDSRNELIYQDDLSGEEHNFYSNQEKQQVSMSMVRPNTSLNHHKLLTVSLAVLAVILLAVDIGLGVYYNKLTGGPDALTGISREVAKLQAAYNSAIQSRDDAKKQLASEIREQELTRWELEHQKKRTGDYETLNDKILTEIAALESHIPMIKEGCRHCLPGWIFMNSECYFLAVADNFLVRSWQDARHFCKQQGGDLAVIDSREKHLTISTLVNNNRGKAFWIGLTDVVEEGIWKWLDDSRLVEGYWNDGEPNNVGNEDCAATFARTNPFKAWNDAPCNHGLNWICQMTPRVARQM